MVQSHVGVRQWCKLSPCFFILLLEARIQEAVKTINRGVSMNEQLQVNNIHIFTYSLFAEGRQLLHGIANASARRSSRRFAVQITAKTVRQLLIASGMRLRTKNNIGH